MGFVWFCSGVLGLSFSEAGLFVIGFGWGKLLFRGSMRRLLFLRCGVCTLDIQTHCQDPVWMRPQKNFLRRVWLLGVSNSHLQTPGMTGGFWRSTVYMCWWSRFEGFFFAAPPPHTRLMLFWLLPRNVSPKAHDIWFATTHQWVVSLWDGQPDSRSRTMTPTANPRNLLENDDNESVPSRKQKKRLKVIILFED